MTNNYSHLVHYASPYYDPEKAHEYYMEHRKLKGRSTSSLNDKGKEAAEYIKSRLNEERDSKIKSHQEETSSAIESRRKLASSEIEKNCEEVRSEIASHSAKMNYEIERLRKRISHMSPKEKAIHKDALEVKIGSLRSDNQKQRESLKAELKARNYKVRESEATDVKSFRDAYSEYKSATKSEYDQKYYDELDKILSDASFKKSSSSKKNLSGSSKTIDSKEALKKYKEDRERRKREASNK